MSNRALKPHLTAFRSGRQANPHFLAVPVTIRARRDWSWLRLTFACAALAASAFGIVWAVLNLGAV